MFDVGGGELLLILLAVLLLFGPKKIPEVAQMVGKGIRQFRKAQEDLTQQIRDISAETASIVEEPVRVKPELRSEERRKESDELQVTSDE
ncbi:MAG: twin-arginine translocase TatA/TatE family subunit [Bacteroidetes bacterium]|nr:twin-arginine translocase TatA/TatE family subunit [Bacteroidota bacterium]